MSDKQILLDHLVSKNQATLTSFGVTLTVNDLDFNYPEAGDFLEGNNTRIIATMRSGRRVRGSNIYHYSRNDLQAAFAAIGVEDVVVSVEGDANIGKVIVALYSTYNLQLDLNDVVDIVEEGDTFTFGVRATNLLWIGTLKVRVVEVGPTPLEVAFPNNVLDGFNPPDFA